MFRANNGEERLLNLVENTVKLNNLKEFLKGKALLFFDFVDESVSLIDKCVSDLCVCYHNQYSFPLTYNIIIVIFPKKSSDFHQTEKPLFVQYAQTTAVSKYKGVGQKILKISI